MVTLRSTQKLLRRVGVSPKIAVTPPTTVLGDWYGNLLYSRPQQLVVCINERSLLLVLLPARDLKNIGPRLRASVISLLARIGIREASLEAEARAMETFAFGPTANRRVLGCLNEAMFALCDAFENSRFSSFVELEDHFSEFIYRTTDYQHPRKLAAELFSAVGTATDGTPTRPH
jgi:hypothetical protein